MGQPPSSADTHSPAAGLLDRRSCLQAVRDQLGRNRRPALFLDYDGTLTPIVSRPEDARLSPSMRNVVAALARCASVAVVSGRDRLDVEALVGLPSLVYAGSHGYDVRGPDGLRQEHPEGEAALDPLDQAERSLQRTLDGLGAQVERKRYALAVHTRQASQNEPDIRQIVEREARRHEKLKVVEGKKVLELRPALDWDKGHAVLWIMKTLGLSTHDSFPLYLGDDVTDEDAFRAVAADGLGIHVGELERDTAARGQIDSVAEVEGFLADLRHLCAPESRP